MSMQTKMSLPAVEFFALVGFIYITFLLINVQAGDPGDGKCIYYKEGLVNCLEYMKK